MNVKEVGEIRRRIRRDRSNMTAIYGCYVNGNKEIVSEFKQSTGIMPENEAEKYFTLLKRTLSGSLGKNLIDICFKTSQVADSPEHKLLMNLRSTELKDDSLRAELYTKIIQNVNFDEGFLILLGVTHEDTEAQAIKLADKLAGLRIFEDEDGKMNRGLETVNGEILVVSQFTLYGNCKKGRRPEFLSAARPEVAIPLYEKFVQLLRDKDIHVETGEFGAEMLVESVNDGPLTLIVDTDNL